MDDETIRLIMGKNLRSLRHLHGISAEDLADMCGLSVDAIYRYERGEREIGPGIKYRLAAAMGAEAALLEAGVSAESYDAGTVTDGLKLWQEISERWDGDNAALLRAVRLVLCLPRHRRREVYLAMMLELDEALRCGEVSELPVWVPELEEAIGAMYEEGRA